MRCTFRPYEGDEDYIFISYSHEDKERVFPILEALNNKGFRIWYDEGIEWGSEWPDSIEDHLFKATVCMFFYSKTFIMSKYCKRELSLAVKYDKGILTVCLDELKEKCEDKDERQSSGFDILLCLNQAAKAYQCSDREKFVEQLGATLILQSCNRLHNDVKTSTTIKTAERSEKGVRNLDKMLESKLEISNDRSYEQHDGLSSKSPLEKMLYEIKIKNYLNGLKGQQSDKRILSCDTRLMKPHSLIDNNQGKHFSLLDCAGKNTLIFEVEECFDYSTMSAHIKMEQVIRSSEELEGGCFQRTYYLMNKPNGNSLMIYTFDSLNNEVYANSGILYQGKVKVLKKPLIVSGNIVIPSNKMQQLSGSAYNLVGFSDKDNLIYNEQESTEIWYEAKVDANVPVILDITKAQTVLREIYFDENENEWKAKVKLETYKPYLFIRGNYNGEKTRALTPLELGKFYKNGQHGFPKDVIKAIKYLEEDDSADALYEIAHIFIDDNIFQDDESAQIYLYKASNQGNELASIELALTLFLRDDGVLQLCIDILRKAIKKNSHNVMFALAYFLETTNSKMELLEAFNIYHDLAKENYYGPAQFRLCQDWDDSVVTEEYLYHAFQESVQNDDGVADFCLGSLLLYGDWDFPAVPKMALDLLEQAANKKNFDAQYELFELYHEKNGRFKNQHKAYHWCCSLNEFDSSILVELSDWLLDGAGGHNQEEADKQAFSILQHASFLNNKTAINNLGWMYKLGRGCEQNYGKAKELFEQAAKLGCIVAITHLGELYQYGLGVKVDIEQAVRYYKQAADLGHEKALQKLEEITSYSTSEYHDNTHIGTRSMDEKLFYS